MNPTKTEKLIIDLALHLDPEPFDKVPDIFAAFLTSRQFNRVDPHNKEISRQQMLVEWLSIQAYKFHQ